MICANGEKTHNTNPIKKNTIFLTIIIISVAITHTDIGTCLTVCKNYRLGEEIRSARGV